MPSVSRSPGPAPSVVGRYVLYDEIAAGGMATVHVGRLLGPAGFSRTVAIKRLHTHFAKDPSFVAMFLDEARLAARVRHPNVVATLDVAATDGEVFLVMDYVQGESLSRLSRVLSQRGERVPPAIAVGIMVGVLYGLHAAHEALGEGGAPLGIVHRDVSPQNVLVGIDGVARVVDFGIAKAAARLQTTAEGQIKGKVAYMSPEQLRQRRVDRRTDVFAASIVLWEALTGQRLFAAEDPAVIVANVLTADIPPPSVRGGSPSVLDNVVLRGLAREPDDRFETAMEMLLALEGALAPASPAAIGEWIKRCVGETLDRRARKVAEIEATSAEGMADGTVPAGALGVTSTGVSAIDLAQARGYRAAAPTDPLGFDEIETSNQVSLSTPVDGVKRDRRRVLPLAALVAAGLVGTVAIGVRGGLRHSPPPVTAVAAPPASVASVTVGNATYALEAAPSPEATKSVQADVPPVTAVPAPSSPRPPQRAPSSTDAPRRRARGVSDCDPPFVWDAVRQIKVYKKQCQ